MNQLERLCLAITLVAPLQVFPNESAAAPATSYEVKPDAIVIYADNPEERAYDCSIWYLWSHEAYRKTTTETVSETVHVAPKSNGAIHTQPLVYVMYAKIEEGPKIACK